MIEHERSYILDPEFATQIMESHAHTPEPDLIEDYYLSTGLRMRHVRPAGKEDRYVITRKTGDKAKGYRLEDEEEISASAAEILKPNSVLHVCKSRYYILQDGNKDDTYTISIDFVDSPMRLGILEIEALSEVVYPLPATIAETLLGLKLKECPLCSFKLFRRKIGICGGPSSGKSETAKIMSHVLNTTYRANSFHVAEFATTFIQKYHRNPNFEDQFYIWHGQYSREHDAEKANIVISDCPTFLNYIYTQVLQTAPFSEHVAFSQSKMYKRVLYDMLTYTDLIFLRIQDYTENSIRYQTKVEALDIEHRIESFLKDHHISYMDTSYHQDIDDLLGDLFFINRAPDYHRAVAV